MNTDFTWNNRYAGDEAWIAWFEICSVAGCPAEMAAALRTQIESALYANLLRAGFTREDVGADDPVAFFDSYFQLKGSRDTPKPLKAYFAYRIAAEGLRMRDFVCGTLFGSASGRIRDIISDWIAIHKGWKGRTVTAGDGKRHFVWETAGDEETSTAADADAAAWADPAEFLDEELLRRAAEAVLDRVSQKTGVEKAKVALLSLATAQDISLAEPIVLDGLGVGKSRAYLMREKVMKALERELRRTEGADDPLFGRLLLEICEASLDSTLRARLEGSV